MTDRQTFIITYALIGFYFAYRSFRSIVESGEWNNDDLEKALIIPFLALLAAFWPLALLLALTSGDNDD